MDPMRILVEEHVIILKVLKTIQKFTQNFKQPTSNTDMFLDCLIDFFKVFADQAHHGKEENILFKKLENKPLNEQEKKILAELIQEHKEGRHWIALLEKEKSSPIVILTKIVNLYHAHILKENTHFFLPAFSYFTNDEKTSMVFAFYDNDQKVFHSLYQGIDQKLVNMITVKNSLK